MPKKHRTAEEIPAPAEIATAATPGSAGFARRPLKATLGEGQSAWSVTLFGAVQVDYIADTTRSYDEYLGPVLVARSRRAARASVSCWSRRPSAA